MVRVVVAVCTDQLLCRNDVPTCFDNTISGGWLMLQKSTETTWDVKRVSISIGRKCTVTILCMNWCSFFFHSYSSFPKGPETNSEFAPWTHDEKFLGWFFLEKKLQNTWQQAMILKWETPGFWWDLFWWPWFRVGVGGGYEFHSSKSAVARWS